jgi:glycine dehydrogenase
MMAGADGDSHLVDQCSKIVMMDAFDGERDRADNVLKNAPHTAKMLLAEEWHHDYPRQQAAYPVASLRDAKYWPPVGRVDNAWGDRNLVCACLPIEAYA